MEYNHFHRLPEEVMVLIFDRVADLKCLCRCSLVSKHFAAVVSRVRTVIITVTGIATYDREAWRKMKKLFSELANGHGSVEQLHALLDSLSFQNMKLPFFLDKLTELEFVYLDYDYTGKNVSSCISMRKIKFFGNGSKIKSFVALESIYMHKDTDNKAKCELDIKHYCEWVVRTSKNWWHFRVRYTEWICFVMVLVKYHASPQRVTVTDSEGRGKMVMGDEDGVNLDMDYLIKLVAQFADFTLSYGRASVLHLPLSGYAMRWVDLVIAHIPENSGAKNSENLDDIEFWDSEDELPVFREAVKEFLKNYKSELETWDMNDVY